MCISLLLPHDGHAHHVVKPLADEILVAQHALEVEADLEIHRLRRAVVLANDQPQLVQSQLVPRHLDQAAQHRRAMTAMLHGAANDQEHPAVARRPVDLVDGHLPHVHVACEDRPGAIVLRGGQVFEITALVFFRDVRLPIGEVLHHLAIVDPGHDVREVFERQRLEPQPGRLGCGGRFGHRLFSPEARPCRKRPFGMSRHSMLRPVAGQRKREVDSRQGVA